MNTKPNDGTPGGQEAAYGVVTGPGTIRFERLLPGPVERVWAYLTESEKRGKWLASGEMELRAGGRVALNFYHADLSPVVETVPEKYEAMADGCSMTGVVTRFEPPRLLSYTWGGGMGETSEVTFELIPSNGGVLLVLTHRRLGDDPATLANVAAGWHTHLGILADHLNGRQPHGFWSTHTRMEAEYGWRLSARQNA
ncbi:MAG TPA: SRPBCC family protein [Rhodothermales bacterium]|nr:SRPBCC family protein [Rhodothermales bacterium]